MGGSTYAFAQDLFLNEGQYYTDETQTTLYTGRYTEFYVMACLKWSCSWKTVARKVHT